MIVAGIIGDEQVGDFCQPATFESAARQSRDAGVRVGLDIGQVDPAVIFEVRINQDIEQSAAVTGKNLGSPVDIADCTRTEL